MDVVKIVVDSRSDMERTQKKWKNDPCEKKKTKQIHYKTKYTILGRSLCVVWAAPL